MTEVSRAEAMEMLDAAMRNGQLNRANALRQRLGMPDITTEGAGFSDRTAVSASQGPGAGLQTLQNRYGDGAQAFGFDNFVIPGDQGAPTLLNPPGFDMGDLSVAMRPIAETAGALLGGFLGAGAGTAAGPFGVIPGAMAGAGVGGEMAGQMYDTGMRTFAGSADTRGVGDIAGDTLSGMAFNSMGAPQMRVPLQAGTDMALESARQAAGIPALTPGQMGSRFGQRLEGMLESSLTGGPVMDRQRQSVDDAMRGYIDTTFPTQLSREVAGDRAAIGAQSIIGSPTTEGTKKFVDSQLYKKLNKLIDSVDGGRISIPESRKLLAEYEERMARDPEYARLLNTDPDMSRYINTLKSALSETPTTASVTETARPRFGTGGKLLTPTDVDVTFGKEPAVPLYDTLKQFRTNVGSKLDSVFATSADGGIEAEKRRLYGVLSEDLAAGADELGGTGARQARSRADWYHRGLMDRLETIDPVFRNADNPTKVYESMGLMVANSPRGLNAVKKTLPRDVWNDFSDTYIRGKLAARPGGENAAGDAVSYQTIATNLNKMKKDSPEAWRLLAGDKAPALENIRLLANKFKDSEKYFNRSRTANSVNMGGALSATGSAAGAGYLLGHTPEAAILGGSAALTANMVVPWLIAQTLAKPSLARAIGKMPTTLMGDLTPESLARALVAAGANESDVEELRNMER